MHECYAYWQGMQLGLWVIIEHFGIKIAVRSPVGEWPVEKDFRGRSHETPLSDCSYKALRLGRWSSRSKLIFSVVYILYESLKLSARLAARILRRLYQLDIIILHFEYVPRLMYMKL